MLQCSINYIEYTHLHSCIYFSDGRINAKNLTLQICNLFWLFDEFLLAVLGDMADWKHRIRTHYPTLLTDIDTKTGLAGELKELQSAGFPLRVINRIWVMIYNIDFFSFLYCATQDIPFLYQNCTVCLRKTRHLFFLIITLASVDRLSKLFHCHSSNEISFVLIIKISTSPWIRFAFCLTSFLLNCIM